MPYYPPAATGGGAAALPDLTDVDDTLAPSNGSMLQYNSANAWWTETTAVNNDEVLMQTAFGYAGRAVTRTSNRTMWKSTATAAVADQGLNLPAALTELDAVQQGTRILLDSSDFPGIGTKFKVSVCMRGIVQTARTINVSVRSTATTTNILATCAVVVPNTTAATFVAEGAWTAPGAWFTGNDISLAVYTDTGNGADDYVFKDVTLWWQAW